MRRFDERRRNRRRGTSGGAGDGGTAGTGDTPACSDATGPNSGATCNVVRPAARGAATFSTAAPPTPAGGAFAAGTYDLVSRTFYGSAEIESSFVPGVAIRQTYVLSDVTSTSFTLDQVETRDSRGPIARDRRRFGNDRDLHPDLSGSERGNRLEREHRVHRDLELDHAIPNVNGAPVDGADRGHRLQQGAVEGAALPARDAGKDVGLTIASATSKIPAWPASSRWMPSPAP